MTRILVIDDETIARNLMAEILHGAGYEVEVAATAERGLQLLDEWEPQLVVSDIVMPGLSGIELLGAVQARRPSLPVVLVTGAGTYEILTEALTQGAAGLLTKPFAHRELAGVVARALDRATRRETALRERLLAPTLASALANAIEARHHVLDGHCERLASFAIRLAERLSLSQGEIEAIRLGAILHDVGKVGVPESVLLKPGPLEPDERALVRMHALIGDRLLEPLELLERARPIVRHHHERWDGGGYPDGLAGEEIPLGARIVAVADAVEAMAADRVYRTPLTREQILAELRAGRGTAWDPAIVDLAVETYANGGAGS